MQVRVLPGLPVGFHITSDDDSITIAEHTVYFEDGTSQVIPAGSVEGLASGQRYGLFWRSGDGFEVELHPAETHMTTGRWIFLGWWATSTAGTFPTPPTPPPGYGGDGPAAVYS